MYKIAIAGTGYVGLVAGVCFAEIGHNVTCVDVDKNRIDLMGQGICPIYETDLEEMMQKNLRAGRLNFTTDYTTAYKNPDVIFICVGTPEQSDGSTNLSYLTSVAQQIAETIENNCLVVIKSTVPVGTNDKIEQIIHDSIRQRNKCKGNGIVQAQKIRVETASNPEFLAQGTAVRDTLQAARIIIGTESKWAEEMLMKIYEPFKLPLVSVSRRTAEMIKYASNSFLALKISYINEIANLCELIGADIQDVALGMSYDERIGSKFLNAGIGYGGSCFPKDTKALKHLAQQYGSELRILNAVIEVNTDQKTVLYKKACQRMLDFNGLRVAVLGLTFKPGTDDVREGPSLENVRLLLEKGANIIAYDPVGINNFKRIYQEGKNGRGSIKYVDSMERALEDADVCFIFTEWKEIKNIRPEDYKKLMKTALVYDGRNIYRTQEMQDAGVEYYSVGRK